MSLTNPRRPGDAALAGVRAARHGGATLSGMLLEMEHPKRNGVGSATREEIELLQGSTREVLKSLRRPLSGLRDEPTHVTGSPT